MSRKSSAGIGPAAVVLAIYHALALIADLETCARNVRAYRSSPTRNNLVRLLLAEGVFIQDLGLGA